MRLIRHAQRARFGEGNGLQKPPNLDTLMVTEISIEETYSRRWSAMYQPALRPEQIKALYYLKLKLGRPMTELVRDAVEMYLQDFGGADQIIPPSESRSIRNRPRGRG